MTRRAFVAVLLAVAAGFGGGLLAAGSLCPTEDSVGCVWVGPLQGNHRGGVVVNLR